MKFLPEATGDSKRQDNNMKDTTKDAIKEKIIINNAIQISTENYDCQLTISIISVDEKQNYRDPVMANGWIKNER